MATKKEVKAAQDQIAAVYEDGYAEINGRRYDLTKMTHGQRLKVFSFFSTIQDQISKADFSFLDTDKFREIEKVINRVILFDGSGIDTLKDHWEEFPEDYILYISTFMPVICYPFLRGSRTS